MRNIKNMKKNMELMTMTKNIGKRKLSGQEMRSSWSIIYQMSPFTNGMGKES